MYICICVYICIYSESSTCQLVVAQSLKQVVATVAAVGCSLLVLRMMQQFAPNTPATFYVTASHSIVYVIVIVHDII